jgi:hypothetical protein
MPLSETDFGLLAYRTLNLGDDVQSAAAMQYLPVAAHMLDRDGLAEVQHRRPLKLIMNAWFMGRPSWPPAPCIRPLFTSFHIGTYAYSEYGGNDPRDWMLTPEGIAYLKEYQPIGCRDLETAELLEQHGVSCYFSGCLTLTLQPPSSTEQLRREILFVDPNANKETLLRSVPTKLKGDVRHLTHATAAEYAPAKRLALVSALLARYARAHLVVTSRLHCLLPCLAFNTPVLFIAPNTETGRLRGYEGTYNSLPVSDGEPHATIPWERPEPNPNRHLHLADALRLKVSAFVGADTVEANHVG